MIAGDLSGKRPLTREELTRLSRARPWFGRGTDAESRDIQAGEAEIVTFTIRRLWDVNECGPGCCPHSWLVETESREFLFLQSWTALPQLDSVFSTCEAHRTVHGKTLLTLSTSGSPIRVEETSVRDVLIDFEAAECEYVPLEALPEAFRRLVAQNR
jgi:hypothetical protein